MVDPPFASVGDTVTISATVRNFSRVAANNVVVRFYRGDPANNDRIGEDTILHLDRDTGPGTVSITSTVAGAGVTLSVPPGNLSAVTRFDVRDAHLEDVPAVGHPFEVVAFQGSDTKMWGEPIESFSFRNY